ncbi:MAG: two-component regulator propeller domain-containing protein [Saprospiraceae bacterium]|nr:two-component regulator propeller domain-containing protein [Saprospiraceae bacterium]
MMCILSSLTQACNGQINKKEQASQTIRSTQPAGTPARSDTDRLFFIDGQLCAWVRNMYEDSRGHLWFGTNHYGVMHYGGDSLRYVGEEDGLGGGRLNGILEDETGNVWFATWGGLSKYDGNTFMNHPVQLGPVDNDLQCIYQDSRGIIWLGTLEGAVNFDGTTFEHFPLPAIAVRDTTSHLSYNRVSAILEDRNGMFWFGTDGFGIRIYDPGSGSFAHVTENTGFPDNNISGLLEDTHGNIWIGTMYGGISRFDPTSDTYTHFTRGGVVRGEEIAGLYEDKHGNIWFSAENVGVYRFDGVGFTLYDKEDGLETLGILTILEDREGRFWLGGWGGLFRYDPTGSLSTDGKKFVTIKKDGPWH